MCDPFKVYTNAFLIALAYAWPKYIVEYCYLLCGAPHLYIAVSQVGVRRLSVEVCNTKPGLALASVDRAKLFLVSTANLDYHNNEHVIKLSSTYSTMDAPKGTNNK